MRSLSRRPVPRGQAAVEAMLALMLFGAFMHGVVTVGTLWLRGQQAAQASRVAVFASARGLTGISDDDDADVSVGLMPLDKAYQASERSHHDDDGLNGLNRAHGRNGHSNAPAHIGNASASVLAHDWLDVDVRLRRAQATVYPVSAPAFAARIRPASMLSVRRYTVIAVDAGHGVDDATVSRRIQDSSVGWSSVAQRAVRAAQAVGRRMEHVDAPWGRGTWSTDWLSGWSDVGPLQTQSTQGNKPAGR